MKELLVPRIGEVMTPLPQTVDADEALSKAKTLMYSNNIRHLPVIEEGQVVGILSDRDVRLATAVEQKFSSGPSVLVRDACSFEPYIVEPEEKLDTVSMNMAERHIGSALVVRDGEVLGIFTSTDACRWIGEHFRTPQGVATQ